MQKFFPKDERNVYIVIFFFEQSGMIDEKIYLSKSSNLKSKELKINKFKIMLNCSEPNRNSTEFGRISQDCASSDGIGPSDRRCL